MNGEMCTNFGSIQVHVYGRHCVHVMGMYTQMNKDFNDIDGTNIVI